MPPTYRDTVPVLAHLRERFGARLRVVALVNADTMLLAPPERDGVALDARLMARIRDAIRTHTTPRHVPAKVIKVSDIPRTISGKIAELAVRKVIHGEQVGNHDALANPEALALYAALPELGAD